MSRNAPLRISSPTERCCSAMRFLRDSSRAGIERQQIKIVVGAAVQNAAAAINSSVNQRACGAAVLGLKVIDGFADFHVRVMPEEHLVWLPFLREALDEHCAEVRRRYFLVPFDRLACEWIL